MVESGRNEYEMAHASFEAVGLLGAMGDQMIQILRRHVQQATERTRLAQIDHDERHQYRYAVGFVDLVGFTEISGAMSSRELAVFIRDFEGRAHDVVTDVGARVVKLIGDEVMFVAIDADAACRAASALMGGFGNGLERVVPRGGLAFGDVLVRGGDYYGSVVNLAARLVEEAVPQELLVSQELVDAAPASRFEPAGRRMVKGFEDPIPVHTFVAGQET
jgi:adenylate cyclase